MNYKQIEGISNSRTALFGVGGGNLSAGRAGIAYTASVRVHEPATILYSPPILLYNK